MLADFTCDDVTIRRPRRRCAWTWAFEDDDSGAALPITDTTVVEERRAFADRRRARATSGAPPLARAGAHAFVPVGWDRRGDIRE